MTSLDTNILVRLIVRDDPAQAARAADLIRTEPCWVPTTVILETEWVLRAVYGYEGGQTAEAFDRLASMHNVHLQDSTSITAAIEWHRAGLDFADALHLASSRGQDRFASYDGRLRRASARLSTRPPVITP